MKVGFNSNTWNGIAPIVAGGCAVKTGFDLARQNWKTATGKDRNVSLLKAAGGIVLGAAGITTAVVAGRGFFSGK